MQSVDRTGLMTEIQSGQGEKHHQRYIRRWGNTELKGIGVNEQGRLFLRGVRVARKVSFTSQGRTLQGL